MFDELNTDLQNEKELELNEESKSARDRNNKEVQVAKNARMMARLLMTCPADYAATQPTFTE